VERDGETLPTATDTNRPTRFVSLHPLPPDSPTIGNNPIVPRIPLTSGLIDDC